VGAVLFHGERVGMEGCGIAIVVVVMVMISIATTPLPPLNLSPLTAHENRTSEKEKATSR